MSINKLLIFVFIIVLGLFVEKPAAADEPSYADTVSFLRNKVLGIFLERQNCQFSYSKPNDSTSANAPDHQKVFDAKLLDRSPKWVENGAATFVCADGANCATLDSSMAGNFIIIDGSAENINQVVKAMSHLIDLCKAQSGQTQLFK